MSNRLKDTALLKEYEQHLTETLLPFWMRSIDWEDGGYYNCYDNSGRNLVSQDKYTWSQGRFVWMFAKLATMDTNTFNQAERDKFLEIAGHGARFLMDHCLLENGNCTFIMDKKGKPKVLSPEDSYDSSIFADCFVILGLSKYAAVTQDEESLQFAETLYASVVDRIERGTYNMEPYPTPQGFKSHNIPMILLNTSEQLLEALEQGQRKDGETIQKVRQNMESYIQDITSHFIDEHSILNEMITTNNERIDTLLGRYCNPGHTIEDMWFIIHAAQRLNLPDPIEIATRTTKTMFDLGWDEEHGGLFLFVDREGGRPQGSTAGIEDDPMVKQIQNNWDNKLWWPHSEALYTTLLCYELTQDNQFLQQYEKVHEYTFRTFPNPDREVGEWIQIRDRLGEPINKVVALPVKDPFHIIRNVILVIELLHKQA